MISEFNSDVQNEKEGDFRTHLIYLAFPFSLPVTKTLSEIQSIREYNEK